MVARISQCDRGQLRLALENRLADLQAEDLSRHLQSCPHCQAELEQLAGSQACWDELKTLSSSDELGTIEDNPNNAATHTHPPSRSVPEGEEAMEDEPALDFLSPAGKPGMLGRLGGYEIEKVIGHGGMGVVLKAHDPALNRCVAIKVMAGHLVASAAARKRFAHEAQAAAAVVHDHVVPIYAVDTSGRMPFLVMPYVTGRSLQDRLDVRGVLETKEVLRIALQTAQGLAAAHAQGLIHRDIKPANILLENGVERVRITDFGLARASDDASQTQSGFIAGTPQYMAPEQARGEPIDARADLFSLGSVMYAMCTGHPPFRAETTLAVLRRICDDAPRNLREINPDVAPWLARIINRLIAKSPADRFQTADEVARLLEQWLAHLQQPTVIPPPELPCPENNNAQRRAQVRRQIVAIGGFTVVATIVLVVASTFWRAGTSSVRDWPQWQSDGGTTSSATALQAKARPETISFEPLVIAADPLQIELDGVWRETAELGLRIPPSSSTAASLLRQDLWKLSGQLGSLERDAQSLPASTADPGTKNE
jgi:eukaryotic-like serine/threonine-protein kinase